MNNQPASTFTAKVKPLTLKRLLTRVVIHPIYPHRVVRSAAGVHARSAFLTVTAEDEDGFQGFGEAATTAGWSGETAETAKLLIEELLGPALIGRRFDRPEEVADLMDGVLFANPFTKAAVDMAIWDLFARREGVSAWQLFCDREPPASVPTRVSIGTLPVAETIALAREFFDMGIRTLKFKVGMAGLDDVERLRATRAAVGDEVAFTVDYNGAFDCAETAARHIESLAPFGVSIFEQPTRRGRINLLARTRRLTGVSILADEAIFTPDDLHEALDLEAFDILSVYPGKNGGITRTLSMSREAQAAGKPCVTGSNLETDLGLAASLAIVAGRTAFPVPALASDFALIYYEAPSTTPALVLQDGEVFLPPGPGFGVVPTTA